MTFPTQMKRKLQLRDCSTLRVLSEMMLATFVEVFMAQIWCTKKRSRP